MQIRHVGKHGPKTVMEDLGLGASSMTSEIEKDFHLANSQRNRNTLLP